MAPGDTIIVLACSDKHSFHDRCYFNFIKEGDNFCPYCRCLIDKDAVVKTKLQAATEMNIVDAFGLSDGKLMNKDVDALNDNDFVRDAPPPMTDANLMNPQNPISP